MEGNGHIVEVPEFVVREVGALHLQLAAAHQEIERLREELARYHVPHTHGQPAVSTVAP